MKIYYFDITEGDVFIPDTEGIELLDLAAVQKAAIDGASSLIAEAVMSGQRQYRGQINVEAANGSTVLTVTFSCPIEIEILARDQDASRSDD